VYDRNWVRISNLPEDDRNRAFAILRWTVFALRPLTVAELTEALLISDHNDCVDLVVEDPPDPDDEDVINTEILSLCESLLECRGAGTGQHLSSMTVQPIHFSVKQYILRNIPVQGFIITDEQLRASNEIVQNNVLASLCLWYFNFETAWRVFGDKVDLSAQHPFRGYAAGSWYQHIQPSTSTFPDVDKFINKLFHPGNKQ
jgi:hypothetical protein